MGYYSLEDAALDMCKVILEWWSFAVSLTNPFLDNKFHLIAGRLLCCFWQCPGAQISPWIDPITFRLLYKNSFWDQFLRLSDPRRALLSCLFPWFRLVNLWPTYGLTSISNASTMCLLIALHHNLHCFENVLWLEHPHPLLQTNSASLGRNSKLRVWTKSLSPGSSTDGGDSGTLLSEWYLYFQSTVLGRVRSCCSLWFIWLASP